MCVITCKCSVHFAIRISASEFECMCVCVCVSLFIPSFLKCIQPLPDLKICASIFAWNEWMGKDAWEKSKYELHRVLRPKHFQNATFPQHKSQSMAIHSLPFPSHQYLLHVGCALITSGDKTLLYATVFVCVNKGPIPMDSAGVDPKLHTSFKSSKRKRIVNTSSLVAQHTHTSHTLLNY